MKTYIYKGKKVFLAYTDDMPGVTPLDCLGTIGCYQAEQYNGCPTQRTVDESYSGECEDDSEIICTECLNFENEQALSLGWYTKFYAEADEFERELCVKTTQYHSWTSELSHQIRSIWNKQENHVIPKWWADSERDSWNDTIEQYRKKISHENPCDLPDVMTFDDILKNEGITIEDDDERTNS